MQRVAGLLFMACAASAACAPALPAQYTWHDEVRYGAANQVGLATWYGAAFAGRATSSGEPFDPRAMTAAHRVVPLGTWIEVRRADNGRAVVVRVTDRGPYGDSRRIVDLSRAAAEALGIAEQGVALVELRQIAWPRFLAGRGLGSPHEIK